MTKQRQQRGFTLMEIVIAVAVFSITAILGVDLFVSYTRLQQRTSTEQGLGSDSRFVTETITRQMRLGTIDYEYYSDHSLTLDNNPQPILAIKDEGGVVTLIRFNGTAGDGTASVGAIQLFNNTTGTWTDITPEKDDVEQLDFYIWPYTDPFKLIDPIPAAPADKYTSNEQPRVTVVIGLQSQTEATPITTNLQTTVTSRWYVR